MWINKDQHSILYNSNELKLLLQNNFLYAALRIYTLFLGPSAFIRTRLESFHFYIYLQHTCCITLILIFLNICFLVSHFTFNFSNDCVGLA